MSSSQHPVALRIEEHVARIDEHVDGQTALLATIMCLPLIDGIFPALVLAGATDSAAGILQIGLLVFGGSATVAVILAEMDGSRRELTRSVLLVGAILVPVAAIEAALAPTISNVLDLVVFERFAALVIAAVAAKTASARIGEYLPRPAVIVGLGFVASVDPGGASLVLSPETGVVFGGVAAALVGVAFALVVALLAPELRRVLDIDRFRFGSAVALGVLPLSILGVTPNPAPLAVLVVAGLLSFDPGGRTRRDEEPVTPSAAITDGGESDERTDGEGADAVEDDASASPVEKERPPWL